MTLLRLGRICAGYICFMILRQYPGFKFRPDGPEAERYIRNSRGLLGKFGYNRLYAFAKLMYRMTRAFRDNEGIRQYISGSMSFPVTTEFSAEEFAELSIAWVKHYIMTHSGLRIDSSLRAKASEIGRAIGIENSEALEALKTLLCEIVVEIFSNHKKSK